MPDPSTYTPEYIAQRVGSGKDKNRAATNSRLAAQATQPPHEDDAAAMAQLTALSRNDGGWATMDAKNDARLKLSQIQGGTPEYGKANDGGGLMGSLKQALGSILKIGAPIAGMAIPGLGPLFGGLVAGGGSALGGALHGDKFNLGKTLLAGGAGAVGQAANVSKLAGLGGGGGTAASTPVAGVPGAVTSAPGGGGGILSKLGGLFNGADGKTDIGKIVGTGAAGLGFLDARKQNAASDRFNNSRMDLLRGQLGMAEQDYAARAPIRNAAYGRLAKLASGPIGSSIYGRAT